MAETEKPACSNCVYFAPLPERSWKGECRFNPPQAPPLVEAPGGFVEGVRWAIVELSDWCGQFLSKPDDG